MKPCSFLLLGMAGSTATAEMTTYLRMLRSSFAEHIAIIMTATAHRFLLPYVAAKYTRGPVFCDLLDEDDAFRVPHVELPQRAQLFLVMPATANLLGKAAHGICDDLLTTSIVCSPRPVVFAPAMNRIMWNSRVVRRNVGMLRDLGHVVIDPVITADLADVEDDGCTVPSFLDLVDILQGAMASQDLDSDTEISIR